MKKIGLIGYGRRMRGLLWQMDQFRPEDVRIVAIADPRVEEVREQVRKDGRSVEAIRFYSEGDRLLAEEELDGVMIGTRCSLHTRYAVPVLRRNLPLFLEKPVCTNATDWRRLYAAWKRSKSPVVVSFPLRVTAHARLAEKLIRAGEIGTVHHVQAWNNVPYGDCYYLGWYRDEQETQGLFLQKATHDFDYITRLLGLRPVQVAAMTAKQVYKGPMKAGLRCGECGLDEECPESSLHRYLSRGITERVEREGGRLLRCGFAVDTGNEDSGSALVEYETGMHVAYSQNFFARRGAGARGARFFGYKGTLEFDWYTNEVRIFYHHQTRSAVHTIEPGKAGHGGGDAILVWNFLQILRKEADSAAPLSAGLLSALMCLKAKESAATRTFCEIALPADLKPDRAGFRDRMYAHRLFRDLAVPERVG